MAFMLNPSKTRRRKKKKKRGYVGAKKRVITKGRKSWLTCLRKAGGDSRLASRLYRKASKPCSKMKKKVGSPGVGLSITSRQREQSR